MREEMGEVELVGLRDDGPSRVAIVLAASTHRAPMRLLLDLEPDEPHRILGFAVEIGD
jgi:hypothetical protein